MLEVSSLENIRSVLREYYGRHLKSKSDLSQRACCTDETQQRFQDILRLIPEEVKSRHYGCGCPVPNDDLSGLRVLDLGSGAGVDAFIMSKLVGAQGYVYGIDMTEEQLEVANRHIPMVMERFGYGEPNVCFHKDFIEVAESIPDRSIDLIISDCVINLSPRKDLVFKTIHRVLKEGGEFYLSDIAADRRVPESIRNNAEMVAECLGGAEYEHDWFDVMKDCGFPDPRTVNRVEVQRDVLGEAIVFYSMTVRGFKFSEPLDRRCEDYGQIATYRGTVDHQPARFVFDDHHIFEAHRPTQICRNTARMLQETRLGKHFEVTAPIRHFGLFACGTPVVAASDTPKSSCC
jgi:arsenite methyltransferase